MLAFVVSAVPQARGADVSMDFIYDNLSGGNWIDAEGYGYGWQPDVVVRDPNWRPYSDGYWAYTDYGWTWISYEDFGWATYHYGRWANLGDYGWVWFAGEDLDWGPAWVSWRTGGDYIGWAPLPPRGPVPNPDFLQETTPSRNPRDWPSVRSDTWPSRRARPRSRSTLRRSTPSARPHTAARSSPHCEASRPSRTAAARSIGHTERDRHRRSRRPPWDGPTDRSESPP